MTTIFVIVATVVVIGYDIYAAVDRDEITISQLMLRSARKYPMIPFAWGVLMGHWFWPMCI